MVPTLKQIETMGYGDVCDTALKLKGKELDLFVKRVKQRCEQVGGQAYANIGYFIGYYDPASRKKLHGIFNVDHPVFNGRNY